MLQHSTIREWLLEALSLAIQEAADGYVLEGSVKVRDALLVAPELPFTAKSLPALRNVAALSDTNLGVRFVPMAQHLPWKPVWRFEDDPQNADKRAICRVDEMFMLPGMLCGLMYVDCHNNYPTHRHEPQEFYVTISGTGRWRFGGAEDLVILGPGRTLYNHPHDWHHMEAHDEPLLALFGLWGHGVDNVYPSPVTPAPHAKM